MPKLLHESAVTPLTRKGDRWKVTLAVPGQGSSGNYAAEVFREYGAVAIPPNTRAYIGHPENGAGRNQKDLLGTYPDGGVWNEETQKFESELVPLPHWREWLDAVAPHSALSIYIMGESDDDGNVTRFLPHLRNSVDLVDYPGLAGSGFDSKVEALFESARTAAAASTTPGAASAQDYTKEGSMEKEILEALKAATDAMTALVAEQKATADAAAKAEADAAAASAGVESTVEESLTAYDEKIAAIEAVEGLFPSQVKALRAQARAGADITPLLEDAKAIVAEAKTLSEAAGSTGAYLGTGSAAGATVKPSTPKGW